MDTGASDDLIGNETTKNNKLKTYATANPKTFSTAGGLIKVSERAVVNVNGLEKEIKPWVAEECPRLISVGTRINEGYSFIRPKYGRPFFVDEAGLVIHLETHNRIPYITKNSKKSPPGKNESDIVQALKSYDYEGNKTKEYNNLAFPTVENDNGSNSPQEESSSSGEEEEVPLTPAQRIDNLLTHLPKRRDCDTCQRAKMRAARRYRNSYNPTATEWGALVSADHVKGNGLDFAIGDEIGALVLKDAHSGLVAYYGDKDQTWETTKWAIREFKGNRNIQLFYTDGAPEIVRAVRDLRILHRTSTPGVLRMIA